MRKTLNIILLIFCLVFFAACSSTEFTISDVEANYLVDESGATFVSLSFKTSLSDSDTVYATLTSPDGNLTWEGECSIAKTDKDTFRTFSNALLPYMVGGEWHLTVSRSDKSKEMAFTLSAPEAENAFDYPEFLKTTKVERINGNVYTIVSPNLPYSTDVEISVIPHRSRRSEYVSYLNGERYKNVSISSETSAVVFTYTNSSGVVFRKLNVV